MKWIKASERLPELYEVVYLKESLNGHRRMGNFFEEEDGTINFAVMGNEVHEGFTIENKHFEVIEWLDESIEGSLKDWKEKLYARIDKIIDYWYDNEQPVDERVQFKIRVQKEVDKLLAPLLQNEYKGDDFVASSKSLGNDIGDAVRSSALTQIEQEENTCKCRVQNPTLSNVIDFCDHIHEDIHNMAKNIMDKLNKEFPESEK
jgi:hypothetical protein